MYSAIKHLHILFVVLSVSGFVCRVMLREWARHRPALQPAVNSVAFRVLPHINDSLLLAAALYLAIAAQLNPFDHPWLLAKVIALLVYILCGTQVIKQRGSIAWQRLCFVTALLAFVYIASVAVSKQVMPWTAWF